MDAGAEERSREGQRGGGRTRLNGQKRRDGRVLVAAEALAGAACRRARSGPQRVLPLTPEIETGSGRGPRGGRAREWRAIRGKGSQKMTSAASPCLGRRRRKRSVHLLPEPHSVSHPRPAPGVTRPRGRIPGQPRGGPASLSPLTSSPTDAVARRRPSQEPRGVRRAVLGTNARPQPWATAARGNLGSLVSAMLSGG